LTATRFDLKVTLVGVCLSVCSTHRVLHLSIIIIIQALCWWAKIIIIIIIIIIINRFV